MAIDYSIYLVTDRSILQGRDLITEVKNAVRGGVTLVQLREKDCSSREFFTLASTLKGELDRLGVPLIINDRLDIALAVDAAGLHVGQNDLPIQIARRILGPNKIIGLSVNTLEEAREGVAKGADYLGVGPVYFTATKKDIDSPTGAAMLKEFCNQINIPMVAIGGINLDNIAEVKQSGIDGVAVVSAILGAENVEQAAKDLKRKWQGY